jgi:hypothetical protein
MDLFKDKAFEEMDEISQMIEPFECQINVELSQFPDELVLDAEFFTCLIDYNRNRLNYSITEDLRKIVERKASILGLELLTKTARTDRNFIAEFFDFEAEENCKYNAKTNELIGEIKVIKKKIAYEDRDIETHMKDHLKGTFNDFYYRPSEINKPRVNEILDLFNVKNGLSERKALSKIKILSKHYQTLIDDKSLNIKDVELFKRFVLWNIKYIKNGSLPALSNITKIKIMMRNGLPIYSIKEDIV